MFIPNTKKYKILTPTGWKDFKGIQVSEHSKCIIIKTNNDTLRCSIGHKLLTPTGFIESQNIKVGDVLLTKKKPKLVTEVIVRDINSNLYDPVGVEDLNSSYISNSFISHNCDFLGAGETFIDSDILGRLRDNIEEEFDTKYNNRLRVFKGKGAYSHPHPHHDYLICADPSLGRGRDYSAFHIIDLYTGEQVAEFYSNKFPLNEFAKAIATEGNYYNTAYVVCERNGIGRALIETLFYDLEYENVWMDEKDFGIQVTAHNRDQILGVLEEALREGWFKLRSERSVQELMTFIIDEKTNKVQADEGQHDDLVLALALGSFAIKKLGSAAPLFVNRDINEEVRYQQAVTPISLSNPYGKELMSDDSNYRGSGESKKEYMKWVTG